MKLILIILALAWAGLFVCLPARPGKAAESTRAAIETLCPGHGHLAEHVDEASRRYLVSRFTLVAQIWAESRCRAGAIGRAGEVGLMQLHGVAANGLSLFELAWPRTNILAGARWLSLRERDCGGKESGLSGYNARTCTGGKRYARHVLATVARIQRTIEGRR